MSLSIFHMDTEYFDNFKFDYRSPGIYELRLNLEFLCEMTKTKRENILKTPVLFSTLVQNTINIPNCHLSSIWDYYYNISFSFHVTYKNEIISNSTKSISLEKYVPSQIFAMEHKCTTNFNSVFELAYIKLHFQKHDPFDCLNDDDCKISILGYKI